MGKLYQRYKRNGRQVGKFTEADYTEVDELKSEDSVSTQAIKQPFTAGVGGETRSLTKRTTKKQ